MSDKLDISFFTERKHGAIVRKCPECGGPVDKDGDTTHPSHCSECPNHSPNEPECKTCGFFPCDQSC